MKALTKLLTAVPVVVATSTGRGFQPFTPTNSSSNRLPCALMPVIKCLSAFFRLTFS